MLVAFVVFPGGPPSLWVSLAPASSPTYALAAPGTAALSALFPRTVDLNSIGRASNAHGFASLAGLLVFVAASAPSVLLVFLSGLAPTIPVLTPIALLLLVRHRASRQPACYSGGSRCFSISGGRIWGLVAS